MASKKHKRISLLLLISMLISFLPKEAFAAGLSSGNVPKLTEDVEFSGFLEELTTFINSEVHSTEELTKNLENSDFEKAIAQRELIDKSGADEIQQFMSTPEKKEFINWLFSNIEAMTLFLEGGEPIYPYSKAFEVWFEIWSKDPDSHRGYELKLAVASALKLGNGIEKWYTSRVLVTPYERYNYYKVREAEGKFPTSMKTRTVWDLKNIIDAPASNWDLDYARDVINAGRYNDNNKKVNINYPPYVFDSIHKDENGKPYNVFTASGDQFFGPNATIKEVHEIGGVCGTASKFGSIVNKSFGIPGFLVGQPGHAAHIFHSPNSDGKWDLGYDVYGWGPSTLQADNENEHIPYTNYDDTITRVPYVFVYEKARTDEIALHKSMQLKWIANALNDTTLVQKVRKIAMETNKWNIDVWRDYIDSMKTYWNEELEKMKIPNSNITVTASSENNPEKAKNVLDNNLNTIWHSKYSGDRTYLPQWITFSFDREYDVDRFVYVPRNNGGNGTVTKYNLYKSLDGVNFEMISTGNLENNDSEKIIQFESTTAKYLKFEAIEGVSNYASASEFKVYTTFENKPISDEEWTEVANTILTELEDQPEAAFDLFRLVQNFVLTPETPREEYQKYIVALNSVLDNAADSKQKSIAEFLKNKMISYGLAMADFNFDGDNAGKLMGIKKDAEYSLDGGNTWKPVIEDDMKLNDEEILSLTAENGIRVRLKGTSENILIPIYKAPSLPDMYLNDSMNKIFNINDHVYYSIDEGKTWTKYESDEKLPDLSGDIKIMLKIPAQGKTLGSEIKIFDLTSKVDDSLILPSDIVKIEANEEPSNLAKNAYDGNIHSFWHTNYSDNIRPLPQSITFELKDSSDIVKLEYMPRQDSSDNGTITKYNIYSSEDGEDFTLVSTGSWVKDKTVKSATFNAKNAKLIRLEATEGVRNYATAAEIRLYRGEVKAPLVSFSFDGDNAGRLEGSNTDMEYSIDGGVWKNVTVASMLLPSEDIMSIKPDTVMHVRFKNSTYETEIKFSACSKNPNVTADDSSNTITGIDESMEYSADNGETWTRYNKAININLTGNVKLRVRTAATKTTFAGCEQMLEYTAETKNNFNERVLYKFINKESRKGMDLSGGSSAENASIIQYSYSGGSNQVGYFIPVGENEYKIEFGRSGKVLSPKDLSIDEDAPLVQTTYNDLDIQKWNFIDLGENEYQIINVATGYALTAHSGDYKITNSKLKHTNNQSWKIEYAQEEVIPNVSFSFDGENGGKLMGSNNSMEYSVDGGATWKKIKENNMTIPDSDLFLINAENDIKVKIVGNIGSTNIDITNGPKAPTVEADDELNIIKGIDSSMEYSVDNGETWKRYSESNETKFMSDMNVLVRIGGKGTSVYGESANVKFTASFTTNFTSQTSYKIINKYTGKTFDIAGGSYADGATILQYGYGKGWNQQWYIEDNGDDSVKIVACGTSKVFTPKNKSNEEGAKSSQTTFEDLDIQKWNMVSLGNNEYQIINKETGFAVTASSNNSDIEHYPLTNKDNQTWIIEYTFDVPKVNFSFDGENAGKILGSDETMEYSIDNSTWKEITEKDMLLSNDEIAFINADDDIKVRVKGIQESARIDINNGADAPNVEADDENDTINGINTTMEYSIDGGQNWVKYSEEDRTKFEGDINVLVRVLRNGRNLASKNTEVKFTKKEEVVPTITFSFDGENASKIMGSNDSMEYSIDGETWKEITSNDMTLSQDEINSISSENGILVRIKGNSKAAKIEIASGADAPNVEADDESNIIEGIDSSMEYSIDDGETWTQYSKDNVSKFAGNINVLVRKLRSGTTLSSKNAEVKFTADFINFTTDFASQTSYKIINKDTGRCFDLARGSYAEGATILQFGYGKGWNQQWYIEDNGDNSVKIVACGTSKVFTPKDKSTAEGTKSSQTTFEDLDIQKWNMVSLGNNEYQIINKQTGLAVTASSSNLNIENKPLTNENNQTWIIDYTFDVPEVSFSFDGENAGKLIGTNSTMEYSVDGETWKEITENNMTLSQDEIISISSENGILVRRKGNSKAAKIEIASGADAPNVEADDESNIIEGIDSSMEYSIDDGETWTQYSKDNVSKFAGNINVLVRKLRSGTTLASKNAEVKFTADFINFTTDFASQTSYKIINKDTGRCFDLARGSNAEGATILQFGYGKGWNQQWYIEDNGDNSVKIVACGTSKVFTPKDKSTAEGIKSSQTTFEDLDIQKWNMVSLGNNEYQIINKQTGLAVTASSSNLNIENKPLTNENNQTWIIDYTFDVPKVSFSFDGENAGKLIGTNSTMEYSIDNFTWKEITENDMALSESEIAEINAKDDIKVRVKGASESAQINIIEGLDAPNVEADDESNIIEGIDSSMEYSIDGGKTWTQYSESDVMKFTGDMNVLVRVISEGSTLPGRNTELEFTADFQGKVYKIISKETGKSFDVEAGYHDDGTSIIQYRYQESGNQQWLIDDAGNGYVKIVARNTLKVFTPTDMSTEEGVSSVQTTFEDLDIQKWEFVSLGNNEYKMINKETGYAATASDDERDIINSKVNNEDNQIWIIECLFDEAAPEVTVSADEGNTAEEEIEENVTLKEITENDPIIVSVEENESLKETTENTPVEASTEASEPLKEITEDNILIQQPNLSDETKDTILIKQPDLVDENEVEGIKVEEK